MRLTVAKLTGWRLESWTPRRIPTGVQHRLLGGNDRRRASPLLAAWATLWGGTKDTYRFLRKKKNQVKPASPAQTKGFSNSWVVSTLYLDCPGPPIVPKTISLVVKGLATVHHRTKFLLGYGSAILFSVDAESQQMGLFKSQAGGVRV